MSSGNAAYAAIEAATRAREWQEETKRLYEQKCQEAAGAEAVYNEAIHRTLEKTEALEKHVKTVTMRSDSLAITEADFFQTLLESQEEAQRNLNELSVQLGQTRVTQHETRSAARGLPSFPSLPCESLRCTTVSKDLSFMEQILEVLALLHHVSFDWSRNSKILDTQPIHVE